MIRSCINNICIWVVLLFILYLRIILPLTPHYRSIINTILTTDWIVPNFDKKSNKLVQDNIKYMSICKRTAILFAKIVKIYSHKIFDDYLNNIAGARTAEKTSSTRESGYCFASCGNKSPMHTSSADVLHLVLRKTPRCGVLGSRRNRSIRCLNCNNYSSPY